MHIRKNRGTNASMIPLWPMGEEKRGVLCCCMCELLSFPFFIASSWWVSVSPNGCVLAFPAENTFAKKGRKLKQLFIKDHHF